MIDTEIRPGARVRTTDGRVGITVSLDSEVAEVIFPAGEEWINVADLVPAKLSPMDELLEHCSTPLVKDDEDSGNGPPPGVVAEHPARRNNVSEFGLCQQAKFLRHVLQFDPLAGLTNARIEPKPHQVSIVRTVIQKRQARMILADEVGLGKTIEAGLIFKELRARGLIERALVVCPASLQMQWQSELLTKFNEPFEIIDGPAARYLGKGGKNPFDQRDLVICSLPLASKDPRAEQIVEAGWDFIIFDEAHRVRRWLPSPGRPKTTKAYELAELLEPHTPALLMLTATPMQLDPYELYSLIQIVEPGIFTSHKAYLSRSRQLPALNDLMGSLVGWNAIVDVDERDRVACELGTFLQNNVLAASELDTNERREELIDDIVAMHPLAGLMVRNRKSEIGGFMGREAVQHGVEMLEEERRLYADIESYLRSTYSWASQDKRRKAIGFLMVMYFKMLASSPAAIYSSIGGRIQKLKETLKRSSEASRVVSFDEEMIRDLGDEVDFSGLLSASEADHLEREIAELKLLYGRLANSIDSKLDKFLDIVQSLRSNEPDTKIVIFTGFKATQKYLADNLGNLGFSVSKFHGGLSLEDKERAIREFRDSSQILISTEAGGEGRNLQFASVLINYDLPWNPMKVEQRIGRLDRIGQKQKVRILNLFRCETVEERVHEVLSDRIRLFEESVGSLDAILGDIEKQIENLFLAGDNEDLTMFERSIEAQVAEARETERLMGDLALDRSSFRRDQTNALLGEEPMATHSDLRRFVHDALEYFGGTLRNHDKDGGEVITLSPGLATKLELPSGQQRGVFDPRLALEREDLDFFALGHRWVDAVVNHACNKDHSTATTYSVPGGPPSPQLEIVYEFHSDGRNPRGEVIKHVIGPELEVVETRLRTMPVLGEPAQLECPGWLGDAAKASQERMRDQFVAFREKVRLADEALRAEDLKRNERITSYRRQRFVDRIEELRVWIANVEQSGTEGQRKILPARRGRLAKDQERLDRIDDESGREHQKILNQASTPASTTWSAALVVGQ